MAPLNASQIQSAKAQLVTSHYTHSVPSGKSYYFEHGTAIIVFSIPANKNLGRFLISAEGPVVWELSRLWAPDGHPPNLLTQAISQGVRGLKHLVADLDAIVAYADPNVGHHGGVYKAASWLLHGQSSESRYYRRLSDGQVFARRKFHSGGRGLRKAEIEALGYIQEKRPGKIRYVKPISHRAKRILTKVD